MKNKYFLVAFFFIGCMGCFDIFKEDQVSVMGDISLINPDNQEDKAYRMVLNEDGVNGNIIDGYIESVLANDSLLMVKSIDKKSCATVYYKIKHARGHKPIVPEGIAYADYLKMTEKQKFDFHFSDNSFDCDK